MKIRNIYIGGWFQRTMLQLSEVYDFLRDAHTELKLNQKKLNELRDNLMIASLDYGVSGEEFLYFTTASGINIKIFEDGLIVLNKHNVPEEKLDDELAAVQAYYEQRLSPAISYIFSLGAPIPKELAGIKNIYPYFIVFDKADREEIKKMLTNNEQKKYFEFTNDKYEVMRGNKYYYINNKTKSDDEIERYIEEQIFIREFKGQMHRYLNIHRIIWEKIDVVKENIKVKGSDIIKFTTELEGYYKTIMLIDGRIHQMGTYLPTREKIAKADKDLAEFLEISGFRYETLNDTLQYITYLWEMTKNYVQSAQKQFESLRDEITSKSVNSLTVVTSMSAGAAILGLFTKAEPTFTVFGLIYAVILAIIGWGSQKLLKIIANRQKYDVSDIEYMKNIK